MSSNPPPTFNTKSLSRAAVVGAALGILGIILFIVFWVVFGEAGLANVARLFLSLCIPPVIIGVIVAVYYIFSRRTNR
jgi:hypothetical protein